MRDLQTGQYQPIEQPPALQRLGLLQLQIQRLQSEPGLVRGVGEREAAQLHFAAHRQAWHCIRGLAELQRQMCAQLT